MRPRPDLDVEDFQLTYVSLIGRDEHRTGGLPRGSPLVIGL